MKEQFTQAARFIELLPTPDQAVSVKEVRSLKRQLVELYNATDDEVARYKIILGVIDCKFRPALPLLRRVLFDDPSPIIRHEAAFGLKEMDGVRAQPLLIRALQDEAPIARHEAADMLGDVGTRKAIKFLRPLLEDAESVVVETARLAIEMIEWRMSRNEIRGTA